MKTKITIAIATLLISTTTSAHADLSIQSPRGITQSQWTASSEYQNFQCPVGTVGNIGINMNFTETKSDDFYYINCRPIVVPVPRVEETTTVITQPIVPTIPKQTETSTVTVTPSTTTPTNNTTIAVTSDTVTATTETTTAIITSVTVESLYAQIMALFNQLLALIAKLQK
jgi:hypothetical protein